MFRLFREPTASELQASQLAHAERDLLTHAAAREYHSHLERMLKERINRLRAPAEHDDCFVSDEELRQHHSSGGHYLSQDNMYRGGQFANPPGGQQDRTSVYPEEWGTAGAPK